MLANGIPHYEVMEILRETSMSLTEDEFHPHYGYGLINAYWAVSGVSEIRVIAGERVGDAVYSLVETYIKPKGGNYQLLVPTGEHRLMAWVDVNGNNLIDHGDYFGESEPFHFEADQPVQFSGYIQEVKRGELDLGIEKTIFPIAP
jgi:hypothetical protein